MGVTIFIGPRRVDVRPGAPPLTIGRDPSCDVAIPGDGHLSGRHARVWADGAGAWIEDLGSTNGTTVDGRRIAGRAALLPGAAVAMGSQRAIVEPLSGERKPSPLGGFAGWWPVIAGLAGMTLFLNVLGRVLPNPRPAGPVEVIEVEQSDDAGVLPFGIDPAVSAYLHEHRRQPSEIRYLEIWPVEMTSDGMASQRVKHDYYTPLTPSPPVDMVYYIYNRRVVGTRPANTLPLPRAAPSGRRSDDI